MQYKKGPYGCFLTEKLEINQFNRYASEIIEKFVYYNTVTVYAYEADNSVELSYDISNLISLQELLKKMKNKLTQTILVREMIGSLFDAIIKGLDLLLSPDNWIIDANYIFYNEEQKTFKFLYIPTTDGASLMSLNCLSITMIEDFISGPNIKPFLSDDEINSILFFIKENKENSLKELIVNLLPENKKQDKRSIDSKSLSTNEKNLITFTSILLVITIGIINYKLNHKSVGILILTSTILTISYLFINKLDLKTRFIRKSDNKELIISNPTTRSDIIFGKEKENIDFSYATITSLSKINDSYIKKALMSDTITIGSDCFLSDIVIDSTDISPLHARISIKEKVYTLTDLSIANNTYIENKKIIPNTEYEIKNGQILSFGNYDFEFRTTNPST